MPQSSLAILLASFSPSEARRLVYSQNELQEAHQRGVVVPLLLDKELFAGLVHCREGEGEELDHSFALVLLHGHVRNEASCDHVNDRSDQS
jgi:hypothetical protein